MAHARSVAGVAVGLALGVGAVLAAAPAGAATAPSPSPSTTGYPPPEVPTLTAQIFQPECDGDVPYLRYAVTATGTENTTVTLTWINPSGEDVVQAGLPLSGRVLWPGAVVDGSGAPLDWPGWRLVDGVWVQGDEFDWVRPAVDVKLEVNPELTLTADYPPSSPDCATDPPGNPPPGEEPAPGTTVPAAVPVDGAPPAAAPPASGFLPQTGAGVAGLVAAAAALVAAGGLAVTVARRRRSTDS
ncbi:LPXTG cell wall anchor domain-containing protein [Isoptericola sp. 4D.3]|uniref:LPXTG cell wall anchor domain-containing protein n=1 Tax=Isoptericola peretonis TaxID=2918523 RepID=A0ABT0J6S9_9MICO|nr:LPXTG cell wall anchor domain-containing protein [Isoptericola sp. 4D.3]